MIGNAFWGIFLCSIALHCPPPGIAFLRQLLVKLTAQYVLDINGQALQKNCTNWIKQYVKKTGSKFDSKDHTFSKLALMRKQVAAN
jgi:hypothetical protein